MRHRKLKIHPAGVIIIFCGFVLFSACNNSGESENNSTANEIVNKTPLTNAGIVIAQGMITWSAKSETTMKVEDGNGEVITKAPVVNKRGPMKVDNNGVYNYTETAPAFPGGQSSLENYITRQLVYPDDAIENDVEGTVYVLFTIDENGKVRNATTTGNKIGYGLEEEALRVVNGMSAWTPGMNGGMKVKTYYTIPITYKLTS